MSRNWVYAATSARTPCCHCQSVCSYYFRQAGDTHQDLTAGSSSASTVGQESTPTIGSCDERTEIGTPLATELSDGIDHGSPALASHSNTTDSMIFSIIVGRDDGGGGVSIERDQTATDGGRSSSTRGSSSTAATGSDSAGEEAVRFKRLKLSHRQYRSQAESAATAEDEEMSINVDKSTTSAAAEADEVPAERERVALSSDDFFVIISNVVVIY
jgi:hypothetical protein